MRNKNTIKINFIRHGKTELNERHCYIGVTDAALSANGITEIREKKTKGIYPESQLVFVSPMKRCEETASVIYPYLEQVKIDEFREMDFGSFEGKCYEELKGNLYYRKWIDESRGASPEELIENYGNLSDACENNIILPEGKALFTERVVRGFDKVLKCTVGYNEVSVVVHGGTIMSLLSAYLTDDYYRFMVSCGEGVETSVTYIEDNGNIEISHFSINNWIRA